MTSASQHKYLIEQAAGAFMTSLLCVEGLRVEHMGRGHGPDLVIQRSGGGEVVGHAEVGQDADPQHEAQFSALDARPDAEWLALPPGSGTWAAEMGPTARLDRVDRDLPGIIAAARRQSVVEISVDARWPRGDLLDRCQRLGLRSIEYIGPGRDAVLRHMPSSGGMLDPDPDHIADWMEQRLTQPDMVGNAAKLVSTGRKYLVLVVGSATEHTVAMRMWGLARWAGTPRPIRIPDPMDEVWLIASSTAGIRWESTGTVTAVPPTTAERRTP